MSNWQTKPTELPDGTRGGIVELDDHELESRTLCVRREGARCNGCGECEDTEENETEGWRK